jgi:ATP-dependent Clp protease ATP-binding subunit ClpC
VRLSVRYITDRYLPDKAIDLIDEAASRVRLKSFIPRHRTLKELEQKIEETPQAEGGRDSQPGV